MGVGVGGRQVLGGIAMSLVGAVIGAGVGYVVADVLTIASVWRFTVLLALASLGAYVGGTTMFDIVLGP